MGKDNDYLGKRVSSALVGKTTKWEKTTKLEESISAVGIIVLYIKKIILLSIGGR